MFYVLLLFPNFLAVLGNYKKKKKLTGGRTTLGVLPVRALNIA